jgi:hypothetical protein
MIKEPCVNLKRKIKMEIGLEIGMRTALRLDHEMNKTRVLCFSRQLRIAFLPGRKFVIISKMTIIRGLGTTRQVSKVILRVMMALPYKFLEMMDLTLLLQEMLKESYQ